MILINRAANRLTLFRPDNQLWRVFPVATGQAIYPTPAGRFSIIVKWVNPTWYPPTQDAWAAGLKPVPPGPGQPARHALDGALLAGDRDPRHRRTRLDRLQRLARLHQDAGGRLGVAVRARSRSAPRCSSSDARITLMQKVAQIASVVVVLGPARRARLEDDAQQDREARQRGRQRARLRRLPVLGPSGRGAGKR